jgi:hypothetical protein
MIKQLQEYTDAQKTIDKYIDIFDDMVKDFMAWWRGCQWFESIKIGENTCTVYYSETIMGETETECIDIPTEIVEQYVQGDTGNATQRFIKWHKEEVERRKIAEEEREKREAEERAKQSEEAQYKQYLKLKEKYEKEGK